MAPRRKKFFSFFKKTPQRAQKTFGRVVQKGAKKAKKGQKMPRGSVFFAP
jgi:hypothetical protein